MTDHEVFRLSGDEVVLWIDDDDSAVMLKAVSFGVDPVELNPDEARELARLLIRLADDLDGIDGRT